MIDTAENAANSPHQPNPPAKILNAGKAKVQAVHVKLEAPKPAATADWIDVLPKLDLIGDRLKGEWHRAADGGVVSPGSPPFCSMHVPVNFSGDYRLEVEFTARRIKDNGIFLHVPVGARYCRIAVYNDWLELSSVVGEERRLPPADGDMPESRSIFRDGKKLGRYKTTTGEYGFGTFRDGTDIKADPDQRYQISVDVRTKENDATVNASLNGRLGLDWSGQISSLSEPYNGNIWTGTKPSGIAFGTEEGVNVEFHALRIQPVGGSLNWEHVDRSLIEIANKSQPPLGVGASVTGGQASTQSPSDGHGLKGSYFRGENFETLVMERIDPQIDFLWLSDAPDQLVPSEHFSVRWEGWLKAPGPGDYQLAVLCDDGVRISLDGKRIIDAWNRVYATRRDVSVRMTDKPSRVLVEYFQATGPALMTLRWSLKDRFGEQPVSGASLFVTKAAAEKAVVPMPPRRERMQGLRFDLFREKEMERKIASTIVPQVDFAWGRPGPVPHMLAMRWSGWLQPPTVGQYRFIVFCDDGIRMWLGAKPMLNEWRPKGWVRPRRYEFEEHFVNLQPMPIRIDHFGSKSSAGIVSVRWIPPGAKVPEIIPIEAWQWQQAAPGDRASHPAGDQRRLQAPQPSRGPRPASAASGL